jgi:hypothetical protein
MAKAKKTTRSKKPAAKVQDLAPKNNPKGGLNFTTQQSTITMGDGSVAPNPELNFNTWSGKR